MFFQASLLESELLKVAPYATKWKNLVLRRFCEDNSIDGARDLPIKGHSDHYKAVSPKNEATMSHKRRWPAVHRSVAVPIAHCRMRDRPRVSAK